MNKQDKRLKSWKKKYRKKLEQSWLKDEKNKSRRFTLTPDDLFAEMQAEQNFILSSRKRNQKPKASDSQKLLDHYRKTKKGLAPTEDFMDSFTLHQKNGKTTVVLVPAPWKYVILMALFYAIAIFFTKVVFYEVFGKPDPYIFVPKKFITETTSVIYLL